ncbi:MAG: hypothetical protein IKI58_04425 [Oscillospiraceae bacterium]|nr:hypothetical protein [Oscillospiraceae bacterium]
MAKNELISAVNSLNYNIVLDEEVLKKASQDMDQLFKDIKALLHETLDVFNDFAIKGMNTPTGWKINNLFLHSIYEPYANLYYVAEHVSENLRLACSHFQPVFQEYKKLVDELD